MNILLDTHYAIWCLFNSDRLKPEVIKLIENPDNNIYVSSSSIWEISNKHINKPEKMPISGIEFYEECLKNDIWILPVQAKVIKEYEDLKLKKDTAINKDPFDRILVAQAKHYKYMLLSHDHCMKYYEEPYILNI